MAKAKRSAPKRASASTFEGIYFFKMVLYVLFGSLWLKISHGQDVALPIPIGLIIGLIFTTHEHFRIDRKIEYVVLLVAMLVGFFAPYGIYISF
jgi:hypothetical protein